LDVAGNVALVFLMAEPQFKSELFNIISWFCDIAGIMVLYA
jgi:hypothetical protein